ncbi:MAG TPA: hypothetical protein VFE29_06480, partial [Terriglobia bacterium]|nr:hypothetical protein [Terriglobia bacterium]
DPGESEEISPDATGLVIENLDLALALFKPDKLGTMNPAYFLIPKMHSLVATADTAFLVGMEIVVEATISDIRVEVNSGKLWKGGLGTPVVNIAKSFENTVGANDGELAFFSPVGELAVLDADQDGWLELTDITPTETALLAALAQADSIGNFGNGDGRIMPAELLALYDVGDGLGGGPDGRLQVSEQSALAAFDDNGDGQVQLGGFQEATGELIEPLGMDFDGEKRVGASAQNVSLVLANFIYVTGSLAFEKGPTYEVDIETGLPAEALEALDALLEAATGLPSDTNFFVNNGTVLHDIEVKTLQVGGGNLNAFIGANGPYWIDDLDGSQTISWAFNTGDGDDDSRTITLGSVTIDGTVYSDVSNSILPANLIITLGDDEVITVDGVRYGDANLDDVVDANETSELSPDAIGLVLSDLDFGLVQMTPTLNPAIAGIATLLELTPEQIKGIIPKFTAAKATAETFRFVGWDELDLSADHITLNYNNGTKWFDALGPPVVNFASSSVFADELLALFDDDGTDGVTVGDLRALTGDNAGTGAFAGLYAPADSDDLVVDIKDIVARLDAVANGGNGDGSLKVTEAEAILVTPSAAALADADGDGKLDPLGFEVKTGGAPVFIDFDGNQRIGFSSERITLRLSDFVHVTGGFAFEKGPEVDADIAAGLPAALLPIIEAELNLLEPGAGTEFVTNFGTVIQDVELETFQVGASNVHAFVGINGPYWTDDLDGSQTISWAFNTGDGDDASRTITLGSVTIDGTVYSDSSNSILPANTLITLGVDQVITVGGVQYGDANHNDVVDANETAELNPEATGLVINNLDFGMVTMTPTIATFAELLSIPEESLKGIIPKFTALKATADEVALVGIDGLVLSAQGITVNYNNGTKWFGLLGPPVVNFKSIGETSPGANDGSFEVMTGGDPVLIDFDGKQRIGASVENATLRISEFVHITGSFAFEKGPVQTVALGGGLLSELGIAASDLLVQFGFPESLADLIPGAAESKALR